MSGAVMGLTPMSSACTNCSESCRLRKQIKITRWNPFTLYKVYRRESGSVECKTVNMMMNAACLALVGSTAAVPSYMVTIIAFRASWSPDDKMLLRILGGCDHSRQFVSYAGSL